MTPAPIAIGDVVQINPASGSTYGGCLMIVTELLGWAVDGAVSVPDVTGAKVHQYRAEMKDVARVGAAAFRGTG